VLSQVPQVFGQLSRSVVPIFLDKERSIKKRLLSAFVRFLYSPCREVANTQEQEIRIPGAVGGEDGQLIPSSSTLTAQTAK